MVKRNKVPIFIKHFIIEQKEKNNLLSLHNIVDLINNKYNIELNKSTISKILKNKNIFLNINSNNICRINNFNNLKIEELLFEWINKNQNSSLILTDNIIKLKANKIAINNDILNYNFTNGNLWRFK